MQSATAIAIGRSRHRAQGVPEARDLLTHPISTATIVAQAVDQGGARAGHPWSAVGEKPAVEVAIAVGGRYRRSARRW
jgi:hypothetical protein